MMSHTALVSSRVHTNNNVEATLSNATSRTLLRYCCRSWQQCRPFWATMSNEISSFRQSRNKLNLFILFRLCRKDEISFDILGGNYVEETFDFIEKSKFYDKLVRHCCRFWQQSQMLLRQSRTLLRHCCRCGRGFSLAANDCALN